MRQKSLPLVQFWEEGDYSLPWGGWGCFYWVSHPHEKMDKERNVISLKMVKLHTRTKADLDSLFHNILFTTSYFRCLSSKLPHIHIGFSLQQRQQSLALTNGLQIRGTDVITWLCGLKDKHRKIHLLLSPRLLLSPFGLSANKTSSKF